MQYEPVSDVLPVSWSLTLALSFESDAEQTVPSHVPMLIPTASVTTGDSEVIEAVIAPGAVTVNVKVTAPFLSMAPEKFSVMGVGVGAGVAA